MLYMPAIFGESLMDDWMDGIDRAFFGGRYDRYGQGANYLMKTDVHEQEDSYRIEIELPGYQKDQIQLALENGYLTITAEKSYDQENTDDKTGKVIRQERYAGTMKRSFYVGDEITEDDIKARLEQGVLLLTIPKKDKRPLLPERKTIAIE